MAQARTILHVDMDAFFAAIEQRDFPHLRGKPVLVGGGRGGEGKRGVVTTASYEARPFGCRSAMPMAQARRLCPQAVVMPVRMDVYANESRRIRAVLDEFSPDVQAVSIDEAFVDLTNVPLWAQRGEEAARRIKARIKEETQLTASVGVAPNKFLAKVASDLRKPDGLCVINADEAAAVLGPMPVGVIYGIGKVAQSKLESLGIRTVDQLRTLDDATLHSLFGDSGLEWKRLGFGIDDRPVREREQAKSIGRERTFSDDIADPVKLRAILMDEVEHATRNLRADGLHCRRVSLKLRHPDFRTFTRAATLPEPTDRTDAVWAVAGALLDDFLRERPGALRLLGVSLQELEPPTQLSLFAEPETKKNRVDAAADVVVAKFGKRAIRRGGGLS